ncbi:MAG TPA: hydroxylamine reductase [Caldisericia bacterium]|nr:hydroxylamine reductase [Caldisericia bacterium]HXK51969.1 hydroxylamine reductase [Caldisericia bacterium]
MSMFCFQCQETARNQGCTVAGVCGKKEDVSNLQDLLVFVMRGIAAVSTCTKQESNPEIGRYLCRALFATITNTNFDAKAIENFITEGIQLREKIKGTIEKLCPGYESIDHVSWIGEPADYAEKAKEVGLLSFKDEDVRSLRSLLLFGLKGIAAYTEHAQHLGKENPNIYAFLVKALHSMNQELSVDEMVGMVMEAGKVAVDAMELLDEANTSAYENPVITKVNIGTRSNPGILVSGHDLKDLEQLLKQTQGTGVDVYTHGEMLPSHYYPGLKKYEHLVGNYGNAWWMQQTEFAAFNGPILMTTNCIVPVKEEYKDRIFTTSVVGYPGIPHIEEPEPGKEKDFSKLIELAKKCPPPTEIETGSIVGGFAHNQVLALADKVVDAVKSGAIKRFIVMAGCDGRHKTREYYTDVANNLPKDTIILTAGCAKYRYNKLDLGDIGGIPRILDAGQCNDCYSLAVIALKLKEVFGVDSINDLPISFDIAWYEQKAVAVLLALLYLGVKNIRLGPTLPAFVSPNVAKVLVENFNIQPPTTVEEDIDAMMKGH